MMWESMSRPSSERFLCSEKEVSGLSYEYGNIERNVSRPRIASLITILGVLFRGTSIDGGGVSRMSCTAVFVWP